MVVKAFDVDVAKFNPNHAPAGSPAGGQFTSDGGGAGELPEPRDFIPREMSHKFSLDEEGALRDYKQTGFDSINRYLARAGRPPIIANSINDTIRHIDSAFGKSSLTKDATLYRGAGANWAPSLQVGQTFTVPTYTSTTLDKERASRFVRGGGSLFVIHAPKGTQAIDGDPYGAHEREVLLPRDGRFTVRSIEGKTVHVDFEHASSHGELPSQDWQPSEGPVTKAFDVEKAFDPSEPRDKDGKWTGGVLYHVTHRDNRESIASRGLLRSMSQADASVGTSAGQEPIGSVYLTDKAKPQRGNDIWAVDVSGLKLRDDPDSENGAEGDRWYVADQDISPARIRLHHAADSDVEKYSPDQPRDYHGRWTTGGGIGPIAADKLKKAFVSAGRYKSVPEAMDAAKRNQHILAMNGHAIASDFKEGVTFKDPGPKSKLDRIMEKAATRGPNGVTDLSRASFIVSQPDHADQVVERLRKAFPHGVIDEGWGRSPVNYVDRKVLVRYPDGGLGEIQMLSPEMSYAKSAKGGGGHTMYVHARGADTPPDEKAALNARMRDLYGRVLDHASPEWKAVAGRAVKLAKVLLKVVSSIIRPF
jgi:hypothetical protein